MLKILEKVPTFVYLASFAGGAAATYFLFLTPKQRKNSPKLNGYPRGLINCKNDCFINVILQSLAASDKVTQWLIQSKTKSNSLFETLADIIARINRLETVDDEKLNIMVDDCDQCEFYAAQSFRRALSAHNWSIKPEEHDCHELFQLIMDILDEEQMASQKSLKSLNYFSPSHLKESSQNAAGKNPFHGYFVNQLQCLDCSYKYPLRMESFYSLSLILPNQKGYGQSVTLTDCINNYFKAEHIAGMKCENCSPKDGENSESKNKIKKGFIKKQAIAKLPECLSIQIQRNSWSEHGYELVKHMSYVQFPQIIKIDSPKTAANHAPTSKSSNLSHILSKYSNSEFSLKQVGIGGLLGGNNTKRKLNAFQAPAKKSIVLSEQQQQHQQATNQKFQQYELKSAVVHYGNAHGGHFVAYRKPLNQTSNQPNNNDWLQISDSDIKRCKEYHLFSSSVYMLFYDKVTRYNVQ